MEQQHRRPVSYDTKRSKQQDARTYNTLPPTYSEYVYRLSYFIVEEICEQARFKDGDKVLDVGSGTGLATTAAAERVEPTGHVTGIDHSRVLVEEARNGAPLGLPIESLPLDYQVQDAEKLDLEDAAFDVVISFSSVMHFPNPERAISEMYRVMKPGGRLVLSYTAVHRPGIGGRVRQSFAEAGQRLPWLTHPELRAPRALAAAADRYLPRLKQSAEPGWFDREGGRRIMAEVRSAGFVELHEGWVGRNIAFNSPDEFYEAQLMINSDLRTRASLASAAQEKQLRTSFVAEAERVLKAGGRLVYPFGAVVLRARRPD